MRTATVQYATARRLRRTVAGEGGAGTTRNLHACGAGRKGRISPDARPNAPIRDVEPLPRPGRAARPRGDARAPRGCAGPEDDGVHMHVNLKLSAQMAGRLAAWEPDVCALQEVPTAAIADDRADHRHAAPCGPRPARSSARARLRDALAARNPDLWRTPRGQRQRHPRRAAAERSRPAASGARCGSTRCATILPPARRLGLERGELVRYLPEPRRLVVARLIAPGGARPTCRWAAPTATTPATPTWWAARSPGPPTRCGRRRAAGAAVLAGDLNAPPVAPGVRRACATSGWEGRRRRPPAWASTGSSTAAWRWWSRPGGCRPRSATSGSPGAG